MPACAPASGQPHRLEHFLQYSFFHLVRGLILCAACQSLFSGGHLGKNYGSMPPLSLSKIP